MGNRKLTIVKSKWLRGTGKGLLLDKNGNMCCLGFLAKSCGYLNSQLIDNGSPEDLIIFKSSIKDLVKYNEERDYHRDNSLCGELIVTNDNSKINDTERQK